MIRISRKLTIVEETLTLDWGGGGSPRNPLPAIMSSPAADVPGTIPTRKEIVAYEERPGRSRGRHINAYC